MLHHTTSDDKYRGSPYGKVSRTCQSIDSAGGRAKSGSSRSALSSAKSYLKNLIQSIADAKLRRMRRELELRGIQFDGPDEEWIPSSLRNGK